MARATAGPHSGSPGGGFRTAGAGTLLPQITSDGMSVAPIEVCEEGSSLCCTNVQNIAPSAIMLEQDLRGIIGSGGGIYSIDTPPMLEKSITPRNVSISPLVQIRLAMRKCPLLPNLLRFRCILGLAPGRANTSLPLSLLVICRNLFPNDEFLRRVLEVTRSPDLFEPMTSTTFGMIAVLPELSSNHFDGLDAAAVCALSAPGNSAPPLHFAAALPRLIPRIANRPPASSRHQRTATGRRLEQDVSDAFPLIGSAICSRCAAAEEFGLCLRQQPATVKLIGVLGEVGNDPIVLEVIKGWTNLVSLSILTGSVKFGFLKCIAQHCPAVTELSIVQTPAFFVTISITRRAPSAGTHLDLLFPRVTIRTCNRYSDPDGTSRRDVRRRTMAMGHTD
ncbi:hypothetical protein B0H17DRAFT_1120284 [Mycena rosella]|uniref:Uncharacterized protein n=1 Tax=Mycena rosella TaxID=1033263 RepID=A0AAD7AZB9_MYCRO|nr:hypothetical protein B0H17DRAFT_1120284 [Mycena rosella]